MDRQDLFEELHMLRRSLVMLFPELPHKEQDWRPQANMRSVWELANHLAQIPAIETAACRELPDEVVLGRARGLNTVTVAGLLDTWDQGMAELTAYFGGLTPDEFERRETVSCFGQQAVAKRWLLQIVTHAHHHRAQLFTYLRLMGRPVDGSFLQV